MAVAFDAAMTAGNGVGGTYAELSVAGTSISSTGMTIGASATLLVALFVWETAPTSPSATWNSVAMTLGPTINIGSTLLVAIFTLPNPATGNKTLAASWTGSVQCYMSCVSFTGTDTTTGIKTSDSVTNTQVSSLAVTSNTNDATVVVVGNDHAGWGGPTNFTTIFNASDLTPNGGASYAIGGTSNSHTFTLTSPNTCLAGVHVIASSAVVQPIYEDDSPTFSMVSNPDNVVTVW